jgi:hypothetical protein
MCTFVSTTHGEGMAVQEEQDEEDEAAAHERRWRLAGDRVAATAYDATDLDTALQQSYKRKLARIDVHAPLPAKRQGGSAVAEVSSEKEAYAAALTCSVRLLRHTCLVAPTANVNFET